MIDLKIIIIIFFIHWFADFVCQTEKMGLNKSKNLKWLIVHVLVYTSIWFIIGIIFFKLANVIWFIILTFFCHLITDYFSSKLTNYYYIKNKFYRFPGFWTIIGLDQFLHYLQLILCYEYFTTL